MDPLMMSVMAYAPIFPEALLAIGGMTLLMVGVFRGAQSMFALSQAAIVLFAVAAYLVFAQGGSAAALFNGSFVVDSYTQFMKVLTLVGSAFAIILSFGYMRTVGLIKAEYPVLIVFATLGMLMMISANDLIAVYLGLELQSLSLYVIAALRRDSTRSSEAGLKYFVLGALSSGMLLYGCSLIYGFTGSTSFPAIARAVSDSGLELGLMFGLVFLIAGLAFKVSAVPFHMWTPDVYEGSPTPVTAFFAAAPKIAGMALFVRIVLTAFPAVMPGWQQIIVFISIASMVLGAFAAIGQRNIKRLMAYSSIGHMGFALVGLAAGSEQGVTGVILYLAIYLFMTIGTFACILAMRRHDVMVETIDDLAGLARNNLPMAFALMLLLFSLAGIPPLAGFFAKYFVFLAAIEAGLYPLAVIGVLSSAVAAFYYLRIIKVMFFDEPADSFAPMFSELKFVLTLSGIFVVGYLIIHAPLEAAAETAAKALF